MTMIDNSTTFNNFNLNVTVNNFGGGGIVPLGAAPTLQLASGIMASFYQPLLAGAFASAALPVLLQMQGGTMQPAADAEPVFVPAPDAQWTATMDNANQAHIDLGDGYTLQLDERNSEIVIHNANTGETTKIWGDPHVDVDGKHAFDFWGTSTFELENGTKITIDTEQFASNPNMYVASQLTITKGDQAIVVDGISQNQLGDLSVSMSNDGRRLDAITRDGFVLDENATGAGWRSELTGDIATQADLNLTRVGAAYGPGSQTPSLGEVADRLANFLILGAVGFLAAASVGDGRDARA
jgi:hypothetical protein